MNVISNVISSWRYIGLQIVFLYAILLRSSDSLTSITVTPSTMLCHIHACIFVYTLRKETLSLMQQPVHICACRAASYIFFKVSVNL